MTAIQQIGADLRQAGHDYMLQIMARRLAKVMQDYALRTLDDLPRRVRLGAERASLARMLRRATPPEAMAAAPVAPARGPMQLLAGEVVSEYERRRGSKIELVTVRADSVYWQGLDRVSVMCAQAEAAHRRAVGDPATFVPPFTRDQIEIARRYAALVEQHDAGGMRCTNLSGGSGGGKGGDFMDAYLAVGREIVQIRRDISLVRAPDGSHVEAMALEVRRIRPSARAVRSALTARRLVDLVVLGDMDLTAVLRAHGWVKSTGNLTTLRDALCLALERARGNSDAVVKKGD